MASGINPHRRGGRSGPLFVGQLFGLSSEERREHMRRAAYLVVPSASYDERPLVEAFASGLAIVACRLGVAAQLVESGRNGLLFEPASARGLARKLAWAEAFPEKMRQMGECAQADYHARLVAHWSYQKLFGERRRFARTL